MVLNIGSALIIGLLLVGCGKPRKSNSSTLAQAECVGFATNSKGQPLSWGLQFPVVMQAHQSVPKKFIPAIQKAMTTWNEALGFTAFELSQEISLEKKKFMNSISEIYWQTNWSKKNPSLQGQTALSWLKSSIVEADILINAVHFPLSLNPNDNEVDAESLILHELGHVLGLAHHSESESVMAEGLTLGEIRRSLTLDDQAAIQCRYPKN